MKQLEKTQAEVLKEIMEYLAEHCDIEDGSDGYPRPNWAMRMLSEFADSAAIAVSREKK